MATTSTHTETAKDGPIHTPSQLDLFHFNPLTFSLTFAIFISLLLVLSTKVWKPILKALDERDETIRDDLDQAKANKEEAAKLLEDHREAMNQLREEGRKIREEAVAMAEKQKEEIINAAKVEADKLVAKAKEELAREKEAAFEDFKNLTVDIGVQLASKLIAKEMDVSAHSSAIKDSLSELKNVYNKAV